MMEKSFLFGLMLGAVGGAMLVSNSRKLREMVKKGQTEIKQKVTEYVDDKFEEKIEADEKNQTKTKKA